MNIVKADRSNLNELTDLALKLWPGHTWEELRTLFEGLLDTEKAACYLAEVDGAYVGFIYMSLRVDYVEGSNSSPVGYIEGIYVDPKYRNKGISRMLVETGERWSKSFGCSQLASDTELDNYTGQEFHKKIGFEEAGRIVAFIKSIE